MSFILKVAFLFGITATCERYIFSFGDSYTTVGFNINKTQPRASNPIGNPKPPGNTTSGGSNYIEFLTNSHDHTLTYDLAVAGAVVNNTKTHNGTGPPDFSQQLEQFSSHLVPAPPSVPWTGSNSLFTVFFGINDICYPYIAGTAPSPPFDQIFDDYFSLLDMLYSDGARRFILVAVPPVNQTPLFKSSPLNQSAPAVANNITTWNSMLQSGSENFEAAHMGSDVRIFMTESDWTTILNNPMAYGAPNNTCTNKDGTSCLFWDTFHPGQAIQHAWGNDIIKIAKKIGFFG